MKDMSRKIFGKYVNGFVYAGFVWSDEDESFFGKPKWGALSDPHYSVRVKYGPLFRLRQLCGLVPKHR